jgi:coenzyme F420-reducing hydrogenase delta subunit
MIRGHAEEEPDVREKDVIEFCNENNIFHVKIDGGSNRGLKEAFEYGPCSYILKKENNVEATIFR